MSERTPYLVVAERQDHSTLKISAVTPDEYLEGKTEETLSEGVTLINLCRSYQYLSKGYYVSLLADARHQRALPSLKMIEEITNPFTYFMALKGSGVETIEFRVVGGRRVLPKMILPVPGKDSPGRAPVEPLLSSSEAGAIRYQPAQGDLEEVTSVFGRTTDPRFRKHCSAVFKVYRFPALKIRMYRDEERWKVGQLYPLSIGGLERAEIELLVDELASKKFTSLESHSDRATPNRIAVLLDKEDPFAPSDDDTFEKLRKLGERRGVLFEDIGRDDLAALPEYDALFLRTVTGMDHYSFLFAQRAKSLGIPVIDDPQTTVRCSNKVYLHELFKKAGLPTPRTLTISRRSELDEMESLGYPLIVKQPDGTFSAAVKKVSSREELQNLTREMFKRSPLLTLQEYRPTEFDWRVGVLDGAVLYVCKYHMVKGHWQIASSSRSGRPRYGEVEAVALDQSPVQVRSLALEAAALIGDGLYGVDVKETDAGPVLIEINDNPDLWVGEEDAVQGDRLYEEIVSAFLRRIQDSVRDVVST
ncbi:MAG: RimK family protein [Gemmatimonadota bacterium]|nr:MAG: RimK family protein [Gemmatimonadota bacterium]